MSRKGGTLMTTGDEQCPLCGNRMPCLEPQRSARVGDRERLVPTVHLNGTSKDALVSGFAAVIGDLNSALESMAAAAPNARDYYVQNPAAFQRATREHTERMEKLREVRADLRAIWEAVVEQQKR